MKVAQLWKYSIATALSPRTAFQMSLTLAVVAEEFPSKYFEVLKLFAIDKAKVYVPTTTIT